MPSSSSDESIESSHVKKKHKKDKVKKAREEKSSSSKDDPEKKKKDKKERDDSSRHHHKSTERKHEKESKSKRRRSSSDSDGDSDSPQAPKRNASKIEPKRAMDRDKPLKGEVNETSARSAFESKRHQGGRPEKDDRVDYRSTGSTASGGYDDNRKKSSYPSHKRFSDDDVRERSDKRSEQRQQYGPNDRAKGYYDRPEKMPPWKRRRDEEGEEKQERPAWATNRVIQHAEQIQKRKLLWQRPSATAPAASSDSVQDAASTSGPAGASSSSSSTTNWANMLAATGSDGKSIDKFKRLMGIRDESGSATAVSSDAVEAERHRQETLYRDLDQQYNIARSVTHTGRGKGLGFF
uniref:Small acidic protein-like domain-containing protein n=1 Tax=Plectus sambesii TaxID=2011161 RepID=A0A914URC4_9BILA